MRFVTVPGIPRLHTTPLAAIQIKNSRVVVEVDDEFESRFALVFEPYQAVRVTTADCYALTEGVVLPSKTVTEVLDSTWIAELKANLRLVDETADFMNKARHFILPLQDDFLEVAAWNIAVC